MTQTPPQPKFAFWQKISRSWENAQFRTKLTILLVSSVAIPVIAVTQGILAIERQRSLDNLQDLLEKDQFIFQKNIQAWQEELKAKSNELSNLIAINEIDPNKPSQYSRLRQLLESRLPEDLAHGESFRIVTNTQGKSSAQHIQIISDDFAVDPPLPAEDREDTQQFRVVERPLGIELGNIPIVKKARETGKSWSGLELLKEKELQKLGLAPQANIGFREQKVQGLSNAAQPFPEETYDVDGGKAGLVIMTVSPIIFQGKTVGTVIAGSLLNRDYALIDQLKQETGVSTATIFAQDWSISTNVPYTDKETRAIGTRVSSEVAQKVLDFGQKFAGEANVLGTKYLSFYSPLYSHEKQFNPESKPVGMTYVGEPRREIDRLLLYLSLTGYGIGAGILILGVLVTVPIANSLSQPLRKLANFARKVGAGERNLNLEISKREDEIGILSQEISQMLEILSLNQQYFRKDAARSKFLQQITTKINHCSSYQAIMNLAVAETRQELDTDRVLVYEFSANWQGTIIAESVAPEFPTAIGVEINDPCFTDQSVKKYQQGQVKAINDIYQAGLSDCYLQQLEPLVVKANLVAPLIVTGQLVGLLIAHHCAAPRVWQQGEIDLFAQIATQVGFAIERYQLLEQQRESEAEQRQAKERLQKRALELLMEVEPVSQGDLSIQARVTEDEIGTVADSYNSTIENLRKIVIQVKKAAEAVVHTTSTNDAYVLSLSEKARAQTKQIDNALARIQHMAQSITEVANNAQVAEQAVAEQNVTVAQGDTAMDRTVEGITVIRETVAETAKKVKRLGESSQKISQVVNLISSFAEQTNLLALNASIEAAHAGEEGKGFAVVAEEVRNLSRQSAAASEEIASLVQEVQRETKEVATAMEAGTEQVVYGTQLVEEARVSLTDIQAVSVKINQLVGAIATATVEQSQDSELVSETMVKVAQISQENATSATKVLDSFQELLTVSQQLQETVEKFKVSKN